jgi:hypothetical protein
MPEARERDLAQAGTQLITCFTSTKAQILTLFFFAALRFAQAPAAACARRGRGSGGRGVWGRESCVLLACNTDPSGSAPKAQEGDY